MIPVLTPIQSSDWDSAAERAGLALATLMESAGRAVAAILLRELPMESRAGVLVAAGTGHNGGDGWVGARALHRLGVPVWVASLPGELAPLTRAVRALALADGVREVSPDGPWPNAGVIVDALLGTGARGAPRGAAAALIDRIIDLNVPVLAIDGPTGVDLGTGVSHAALAATMTVTFGGLRRGHLLARDEMGDLVVVDIGHPAGDAAWPRFVTDTFASERVGTFAAGEHKGTRGRVVVIGGDAGMSGAVRLAGRAAFAAGAGLVHVVAPPEGTALLRTAEPDLQTLGHPLEGEPDAALQALIESADAVVIGPGLGRGAGRGDFVLACVRRAGAVVIDADGLAALQGRVADLAACASQRRVVLTPHAGEFRTLFPQHASLRETDPWSAAEQAAGECGATVLVKGVPTTVARTGHATLTVGAGNPGLATGGSGDVLSGILGALLARTGEDHVAAAVAAQCLGRAADLAARRVTARAMRPMDVVAALADLWREWDAMRRAGPFADPPILLRLARPRTA